MITTTSNISFERQAVPPIIPAVQGDTGRTLVFTPADFTLPDGVTATYYVQKPSGEAVYNTATISDGKITCALTAQALAEAGENKLQVRVTKNNDVVTSFTAILLVCPFEGDGAVESTTEMDIFDQVVEQAKEEIAAAANLTFSDPNHDGHITITIGG